jgi:hypothetical protein
MGSTQGDRKLKIPATRAMIMAGRIPASRRLISNMTDS